MNTCLATKYSQNFTNEHIKDIFIKADNFSKIEIKEELLAVLISVIKDSFQFNFNNYRDYDKFMIKMRRKYKYNLIISKTKLFAHYRILKNSKRITPNPQIEKFMRIKGARSRSGVVSVTIFTSGSIMGSDDTDLISRGGCPMDCHYCPFEKDSNGNPTQPRSYLSTEPGNKRASENLHHPVGQVYSRLYQLQTIGHISDITDSNKIELIISGGTFNFYPKEYIEWFSACAYYACNTYYLARQKYTDFNQVRNMKSLEEEKLINETAINRIIGLTIETRPDYVAPINKKNKQIDFSQIKLFRKIGVTRVQIGVQTTKDNILKKINRGCTNFDNKWAIKMLKSNGFKTDIHIMLDLPGSSPEIDLEVLKDINENPDLQADQWKIYPTEITPYTKIKEWYEKGTYVPYADDHTHGISYKLMTVIIYALENVKEYIRINRVVRDIPHISIEGGLRCSNFRQLATNKMDKKGSYSMDIRNREVKYKNIDWNDMILDIHKYLGSGSDEYFIQFCSKDKKILYGFIRLRLNRNFKYSLESLDKCALIRELHVYGQHVNVGTKNTKGVQHKGLGTRLLKKAEEISIKNGYYKIAVISGVGVRGFYRKKGYILGEDDFMFKQICSIYYKIGITCLLLATLILINLIIK